MARTRQRIRGSGPTAAVIVLLLSAPTAAAGTVVAAVASNFKLVIESLESDYETGSGHELLISAGATGQLYAQIVHGAPYDVFFAADQQSIAMTIAAGVGVADSQFTYATGRLALYVSANELEPGAELLAKPLRTLAIANPDVAPYGAASRDVLQALGLWSAYQGRLALAQNVAGAHAAVRSGAAQAGFVALSLLQSSAGKPSGRYWEVPQGLHRPIRQDAVLLRHGATNAAALALLEFVRRPATRERIRAFGYGFD